MIQVLDILAIEDANVTLTSALAIWGALLSTILALLKFIEFCRDRANIKVSVLGGYKALPKDHPNNPYEDKNLIRITAANRGKRPVTVVKACLLMPRGSKSKYLLFLDPLTVLIQVELTEGKSHDYYGYEDEAIESGLTPEKYVACVIDATGRYFWSHNFLSRLIKLHRIK